MVRNSPEVDDDAWVSSYLKDKFLCNIDKEFNRWLHFKYMFFSYFNPTTAQCYEMSDSKIKSDCLRKVNIQLECEKSQNRIVKLIRVHIRSIETLLNSDEYDLRIIHLYRDPRGFMNSISQFGNDWSKNQNKICSKLNDDFSSYDSLSVRFPQNFLQVNYEEFCKDVIRQTEKLFQFAYDSSRLPPQTFNYLLENTSKQKEGVMATSKNSSAVYQSWRLKMTNSNRKTIEEDNQCKNAIKIMNHTIFGSQENMKDLSISLFL